MKKIQKNEFAIGETFQFGLKKLKAIESDICEDCILCSLCNLGAEFNPIKIVGACAPTERTDKKDVIFIEVEDENKIS